jgi:2-keto-3-deoxy-L-rhamnonate aldolase RhmA
MLRDGRVTIGTRVESSWSGVTELVGSSGNFDYIEYVAEYAPFDQYDLENICIAAELHGLASMIKVDLQNRGYVAQKAVAAGFQAILFTDHKTVDEVRESVFCMKSDTPSGGGRFGYPNRRFVGYQPYLPQLDHAKRLDETVLCFMIEKAEAMDNIDAICSVPGVDMVQFGPSDYAMSLGWNTAEHRDECREAERRMIEVALKRGVQPRCEIYGDPAQVQYYIDLGVKHICFGDQMNVYGTFLNRDGKIMREYAAKIK